MIGSNDKSIMFKTTLFLDIIIKGKTCLNIKIKAIRVEENI